MNTNTPIGSSKTEVSEEFVASSLRSQFLYHKDWGSRFLRNVGTYLSNCITSHPRSKCSLPWGPENSYNWMYVTNGAHADCDVCAGTVLNLQRPQVLAVSRSEDQKDTTVNSGFHNGSESYPLRKCSWLLSRRNLKGSGRGLSRHYCTTYCGIHRDSGTRWNLCQTIHELGFERSNFHIQGSTDVGPVHLSGKNFTRRTLLHKTTTPART
jgi:hypothetical protein